MTTHSLLYYYLHENGSLHPKPYHESAPDDFIESTFVKAFWLIDTNSRETCWTLLVESLAAGANKERVFELAEKWNANDDDGKIYADRVGVIVSMDGDQFMCAHEDFKNIQESPSGFGETVLEALADFCKNLGYKPAKTWGNRFKSLLRKSNQN